MRTIFLAVALQLLACAALAQSPPTRVLLVGGPMIADLAEPLSRVASATGRNARVESTDSLAGAADIVVFQQEVPPADRRERFVQEVKGFASAARAKGARPAVFMSWPRSDRRAQFRDTIAAHRAAAEAAGATLVPAAEAWLRALGEDRNLKLYAGEGTQATPLGDALAVLTLYFALFPAGPQEFDEAYVAKIATALELPRTSRDVLIDAATRAIDEPLPLAGKRSP